MSETALTELHKSLEKNPLSLNLTIQVPCGHNPHLKFPIAPFFKS